MSSTPKIPRWILSVTTRKKNRENVLGDFAEFYEQRIIDFGSQAAKRWYWMQALKSVPKIITSSIYWGVVMIKNYSKITFRNIIKDKGYSFINITGFAVGIACSVLIMLWVMHESGFDEFNSKGDRIYRVLQHIKYENVVTWGITQGPLAPALKEQVPEIEKYSRVCWSNWRVTYKEQTLSRVGIYVDPGFFEIFDYRILSGDPNSLKENPNSVFLSESFAKEIFGDDNPINKVINLYEMFDVKVTGIVKDCPDNSHIKFEFISGMNFAKKSNYTVDEWTNSCFVTYLLLKENKNPEEVEAKIYNFLDDKPTLEEWEKLTLQPLKDIHFSSGIGFEQSVTVNPDYVFMFSIAAGLILLLAGINYVNLSTARSALRSKEVGLRKTIGANRTQLIGQFMGESFIIALLSAALAIFFVMLFMPVFNDISGKNFTIHDLFALNILLKLVGILIFMGLAAGLYPSLILSSINPANSLKGILLNNMGGNRLRKVMVVFQYSISSLLLLSTFIVLMQINFLKNKPLGYNKDNLIYFFLSEKDTNKFDILKNELLKNDKIISICRSSTIPYNGITFSNAHWFWEGSDKENPALIQTTYIGDYFMNTYGIEIVKGRDFSKEFPTDSNALVINETAAKFIGFDDPIGKMIYYDNINNDIPNHIIGVCKDYNFRSLHSAVEPLFHIYADASLNAITVKLASDDIDETLSWMRKTIATALPGTIFDFKFLDETLDSLYRDEEKIKNILLYFTILAILISSLGLFGMASFATTRRTKEIGVRKVLGSGVMQLILLLIRDFSKWIIIANVISWPLAYYIMYQWLQDYPFRADIDFRIFIISGIISLLIGTGTIIYKTYRAASANPIDSLKYE